MLRNGRKKQKEIRNFPFQKQKNKIRKQIQHGKAFKWTEIEIENRNKSFKESSKRLFLKISRKKEREEKMTMKYKQTDKQVHTKK